MNENNGAGSVERGAFNSHNTIYSGNVSHQTKEELTTKSVDELQELHDIFWRINER